MKMFMSGIIAAGLLATPAVAQRLKTEDPEIQLIGSIKGPALYRAYCAVCHGDAGKGNGPMAKSMVTPPSDLTRIASRRGGKFPSEQITHIISGEVPVSLSHGTREMPVWGPVFSRVEQDQDWGLVRIDNLVRYLQQIQTK